MNVTGYFSSIKNSLKALYNRTDLISIKRIEYELNLFEGNLTATDLFAVIFWMIVIIKSRAFCRTLIMPLCESVGCDPKRREKVCESFWRGVFHTVLTGLSAYILFKPNCEFCFTNVLPGYQGYSPKADIPFDNKLLIYLLFSYYCFGLYSIMFLDARKKDTGLLICHHFIALYMFLLAFYSRCYGPVALLTFLHDFNDIFLEVGKFCYYFRYQQGKINPTFDMGSKICGRLLIISWFFTRIYYFPLKGLYGISVYELNLAIWLTTAGAWLIFILDLIWFIWIVHNYWGLMVGRVTQMSDITEVCSAETNKDN